MEGKECVMKSVVQMCSAPGLPGLRVCSVQANQTRGGTDKPCVQHAVCHCRHRRWRKAGGSSLQDSGGLDSRWKEK